MTDDAGRETYTHGYSEEILAMYSARTAATDAPYLLPHLRPGLRLLDIGCGPGAITVDVAARVAPGEVIGIDLAEAQLGIARALAVRRGLTNVRFQHGDIYALPFPDATFDAAHCERVLMHLDDPTAALRELRRVVRPGGRVVAAEPDWGGFRLDHPDREAFDLLYAGYVAGRRQPDMGLTLYRRLAEAGLTERQVAPVIAYETDVAVFRAYGLDLRAPAEAVVAAGRLSRARAEVALAYLDEASRAGTFYASSQMYLAVGRVPAA